MENKETFTKKKNGRFNTNVKKKRLWLTIIFARKSRWKKWFIEMRKIIYKKHKNLKIDHVEEEFDVDENEE